MVISASVRAEIRSEAIRANVRAIRRALPAGSRMCAAVKANAYGHGVAIVLPALIAERVEQVAVANLCEAVEVRQLGWTRRVLCLGAVLAGHSKREQIERAQAVLGHQLDCTVTTLTDAQVLSSQALRTDRTARVQVKVDTGMGRGGVGLDRAPELIAQVAALPRISLAGVYSHLATADEPDPRFTREQVGRLAELRETLQRQGVQVGGYHIANSSATFRHPGALMDASRPGLALYGYWCGPDDQRPADLKPVLRVVGLLAAVRQLPAGQTVGYGCTFRTSRASRIGLVPMGYADGYRRALSNRALMTLAPARGQPARQVPVVGRVSMDQTTIDVTDAGDVRAGDPAVIIDEDPAAPNSVEAMARMLDTIPYEITCLLGDRIARVPV